MFPYLVRKNIPSSHLFPICHTEQWYEKVVIFWLYFFFIKVKYVGRNVYIVFLHNVGSDTRTNDSKDESNRQIDNARSGTGHVEYDDGVEHAINRSNAECCQQIDYMDVRTTGSKNVVNIVFMDVPEVFRRILYSMKRGKICLGTYRIQKIYLK